MSYRNSQKMYKKILKFVVNNKILILILLLGLILRLWNFRELYMYSHDQDLQGWVIRDILLNNHPRLIGQETSTHGIFIGPYFYYFLIPFYLIFGMDPIGGIFATVVLGIFTIWSIYYCLKHIFNYKVGLISAFLYSASFYTVFNDREVVPTMPVILWTIWFLYAIHLIKAGKQKVGFILSGILIGLIWNLNMALILLLPLLPIAFILSKKRFVLTDFFKGFLTLFITSIPLIAFELRHSFSQTRAFFLSLTSNQQDILQGSDKVKRLVYLLSKDLAGLVSGTVIDIKFEYFLLIACVVWFTLIVNKKIKKDWILLTIIWVILYCIFFSLYSKVISEYYLNGLIIIWIVVFSIGISFLLSIKNFKLFGMLALCVFTGINFYRIFSIPLNRSGYVERKDIVKAIKTDSQAHGFDCVSISYITDPGFNLGYRYLIWLENLKLKPISNDIPVYTIVFPLKSIFKTDKDFGALGLINPDYNKYYLNVINESCKGDDSNLTESMFGFTER